MNPVQIEALARQFLPIVGTLLAALGFKNATTWTDTVMQVLGPAIVFGSAIWSIFANKTSAVIAKAAALPEVQSVKLEPTAPQATLDATPSNVTK